MLTSCQMSTMYSSCFVTRILLIFAIVILYYFISTRRSDAYRRIHTSALERGEEFWCSTQQAIFSAGSYGYSSIYRITC